MAAGELALALVRKAAQQEIGHGQRQHAIAEELQTLIAVRKGRLEIGTPVQAAAVRQRLDGKLRPGERMAELAGQRRQIDVARFQWIAMKKRFQRMACGHFQGSNQPAAEGSCEKKMNSARPTRFSAGTYQPSWSRSRGAPEKSRNIRRVRLSSESSRLSPMTK